MTAKTWREGYVPGKAKKTIHLDDEVAKALELRAAEERVTQAEVVERALRKELGMVEKLTYRDALEALRNEGYDTVRTNAYDQDITDHLNELDGDGPEVNWSKAENGIVTIREIGRDGYEVGGWLAKVIRYVQPEAWQLEDRQYISEATAFDRGDEFESAEQVREYFAVDNMQAMFGECLFTEDDLNAMAEAVIANRWHIAE